MARTDLNRAIARLAGGRRPRAATGNHVRRSLEAAEVTMVTLMSKYPHITDVGYTRVTDTGLLYRRIGETINLIGGKLKDELIRLDKYITQDALRPLGTRSWTLQEKTTYATMLIVAVREKHNDNKN